MPPNLNLNADELQRLAPDAAALSAAQKLVNPRTWPQLGYDDTAIWGECQGSGSKPYQTQIDRSGPAFRCSCPSRKFPCKHGLALGLLAVTHPDRFTSGEPPAWVSEWLASRTQRRERQTAAASTPATPADPRAAARRAAERQRRLTDGLTELEAWLTDQVRQGLAQLPARADGWNTQAARLVDAQLPGLAERLKRIAAQVGRGEHWPCRVLAELGRLQLLIDGARRLDHLPSGEQADLRAALGLPLEKARVLDSGERCCDDWQVLGVFYAAEERLVMRRVWLWGRSSARLALLLDYSHGQAPFEPLLSVGECVAATLAFYPSAAPLRALCVAQPQPLATVAAQPILPLAETLESLTAQIAANPWPAVRALSVSGVPQPQTADDCWLQVGASSALRLQLDSDAAWSLIAVAGGAPLTLFGEWDGESLRPLSAWGPELLWTAEVAWSVR